MKPEIILVTPKLAKEWMKNNTKNRPLSKSTVAKYAAAMAEGRWKDRTGDPICFNCDDSLIDGQHRLQAIIESETAFTMLVVRGIAKDVFLVKDTGKGRSTADSLGILNEKHYTCLAAALRILKQFLDSGGMYHGFAGPSTETLVDLLEKNPGLRDSVEITRTIFSKRRLLPPGMIACLHYLFSLKDKDAADDFFAKVLEGENLDRHSAEYVLRNRLISNMGSTAKIPSSVIAAFTVKAWNARRKAMTIGTLKFSAGNEDFPAII